MTRRYLLGAIAGSALASVPPIGIASRRELLIDRFLIDRFSGAAHLRLHHPERKQVVLVHDAPWEGSGTGYHKILRDGGKFRMYYKAWSLKDPRRPGKLHIAYAESSDGIRWVKPDLKLVEFNRSLANNIILSEIHGGTAHDFSPFIDSNPAAKPQAKYKAVGYAKPHGLYAMQSSDGIHWNLMIDRPVITEGRFDTQNIAFFDPVIGKYRAYIRDFENDRRDIKTCVSDDFLNWTRPEWLRYPGAPAEQLYVNQVQPYYRAPHIYLGFPARYVDRGPTESSTLLPEPEARRQRSAVSRRYGTAVTDCLLMSSRDGRSFDRWDEAFLRPGLRTRHNWSYGDNYVACDLIETASLEDDQPNELSLFATESYFTGNESRLRRFALRIDGFASAFASLAGGEFVTKPFVFEGSRLRVNYSTSAGGSIRFELQSADGLPLEGLALDNQEPMFGDSLDREIKWVDGADLSRAAGKPVRLRVSLKDADLFSFQFGA
jgi:hypothetical protein